MGVFIIALSSTTDRVGRTVTLFSKLHHGGVILNVFEVPASASKSQRVQAIDACAPSVAELFDVRIIFMAWVDYFGERFDNTLGMLPGTSENFKTARRYLAVGGGTVNEELL